MEVWVLNTNFESIGLVDEYNSLLWIERYNEPGEFELITVANEKMFNMLQKDYYIWNKSSEMVCIIETIEITIDVEKGYELKVSGRSLESILDRRIIWEQSRFVSFLPYAVRRMLNENVITPSDTERTISDFIYQETSDEIVNKKRVSRQYTGDNLLEVIQELCDEAKVGFKVRLNDNNQFVFSLYRGTDRSYAQETESWVIFSPDFDNIINSVELDSNQLYKNIALVAGEGEGAERRKLVVGDDRYDLDRREIFVDARDLQSETSNGSVIPDDVYNASLKSRGEKELSDYVVLKAFEGQLETTQMFQYGRDFFMGDIVQLVNKFKVESRVRVTEITSTMNESGYYIYPTFVSVDGELESEDTMNVELTETITNAAKDGIEMYLYIKSDHEDPENEGQYLNDWATYYNYWEDILNPIAISDSLDERSGTLKVPYHIVGNQDVMSDSARLNYLEIPFDYYIYESPELMLRSIGLILYNNNQVLRAVSSDVTYTEKTKSMSFPTDYGEDSFYYTLLEDQSGVVYDGYEIDIVLNYSETGT